MDTISKTFQIHAHKRSIEARLGIKYILNDDYLLITNIAGDSIFKEEGELRIGHEVVEVNGTSIAEQTSESVRTLLFIFAPPVPLLFFLIVWFLILLLLL